VLDPASQKRLALDEKVIEANRKMLADNPNFSKHVLEALQILEKQTQTRFLSQAKDVDAQLYDDFVGNQDKQIMNKVVVTSPDKLAALADDFNDPRLKTLLPLYKARNFPGSLTPEEKNAWEQFCFDRLFAGEANSRAAQYLNRIQELRDQSGITQAQQHLLTDLELYVQSLMPTAY
jgi:exodeoxyribonuclease-1